MEKKLGGKALTRVPLTFIAAIIMVVLITLLLHVVPASSRSLLQDGTTVAEHNAGAMLQEESWERFDGEQVVSNQEMEESARVVPTGPDPLHHNNKPTRPRP